MPRVKFYLCLAFLSLTASMLAVFGQESRTPEAESRQLSQNGYAVLKSGQPKEALELFERANKLAKDGCLECYLGMTAAYTQLGNLSEALDSSNRALALATNDADQAKAHKLRGRALLCFLPVDEKRLRQAEQEFRAAAQLQPKQAIYRCDLGIVLLRQKKDVEGKEQLQNCLALHPSPEVERSAQLLLADPRRAREIFAPEFVFTSLQGESISLKELSGKVVVLDFWATWCPPCLESVPELNELTKKYPSEKLAVISISADENENQWKDFVAKKNMSWPQYRDADGRVRRAFQVESFPTYLVIDGDGIIKQRIVGLNPQETVVQRLKATLAAMPQLEGAAGK
jgi:thiol-disulfide isomerase/thioredoxin/Tfp pilus assembly protein PilF